MKSCKVFNKVVMVLLITVMPPSFILTGMAQGNLVVNGDFDSSSTGWTITNVSAGGGYLSFFGDPAGCVYLYNPSLPQIPTASQEIDGLTPGVLYIVSGEYQKGPGKNANVDSFGVALDGIFLFEIAPPTDSNWHSFNFDYLPTSTSALLSLEAQINGVEYAYFIDNISIQPAPEPSSEVLLGCGGILLLGFGRWKAKTA